MNLDSIGARRAVPLRLFLGGKSVNANRDYIAMPSGWNMTERPLRDFSSRKKK